MGRPGHPRRSFGWTASSAKGVSGAGVIAGPGRAGSHRPRALQEHAPVFPERGRPHWRISASGWPARPGQHLADVLPVPLQARSHPNRLLSCLRPDVARRPRAAEIQVRMSDRLGKNTVWIAFKPDHRNPEVQAPLLRRAGHSAREPGRGECDLASVKPRGAEPLPSPGSGGSDREKPQGPPGRRRASLRGKRSAFPARHQARSHLAGAGNLPARTEAAHGQEAEKHCGLWERRSAAGRSSASTRTGRRNALRAVGATECCWQKLREYAHRKQKSIAGCGSDGALLAEAKRLRAKEAEKHCGLWE
jgi:hypothetical protein